MSLRVPRAIVVAAYAQFVIALAFIILVPILLEVAEEFQVGISTAGQLATAATLASGLGAVLAGPTMDRYDRRWSMLLALGLAVISSVSGALATDFGWMVVSRVFLGLSFAIGTPTMFAVVGDALPFERRATGMAWLTVGMGMGFAVGAPAIAFIAGTFEWRAAYWAGAVVAVIGLLLVLFVFPSMPPLHRAAGPGGRAILASYRAVLANRQVRAALVLALFAGAPYFIWQTYLGAFFQLRFDLPLAGLAPMLALNGLGFVLGSVLGAPLARRFGPKRVVVAAMLILAAAIGLQAYWVTVLPLSILLVLVQSGMEAPRIGSTNAITSELDPARRAAVSGIYSGTVQLGLSMGAALAGPVLAMTSFEGLAAFAMALGVLGTLVMAFLIHEPRRRVVSQPDPVAAPPG